MAKHAKNAALSSIPFRPCPACNRTGVVIQERSDGSRVIHDCACRRAWRAQVVALRGTTGIPPAPQQPVEMWWHR